MPWTPRLRTRTLLGALVLAGLAWLAAPGQDTATAGPEERSERKERAPRQRRSERKERSSRTRAPEHPKRRAGERRTLAADSPWASREACERALTRGGAAREPGVARVGAWNLHWFPDGKPGDKPSADGSDLAWLACTIAWMRVDVLAVEEIKRPPRGKQGLEELRTRLDALTGGLWQTLLDDCPRASSQHVGLLFDAKRVKLATSATVGSLNPRGSACAGQLRPGLAGYFSFPGGLDLTVIAAHLKSGPDARGIEERRQTFDAFKTAVAERSYQSGDRDVLLIGDMNTMGCESCTPVVSPGAELTRVDALFSGFIPAITRVPAEPSCSHHYANRSVLLDWAAKSDLGELPSERRVTVSGVCAELGCDDLVDDLPAQASLSDHCPIWLDVKDEDRDP
jgi:endonuclease/exonuclease/phosphatase family metal-dependent hydrolase